ncbi:terpene synthase family protein [Flavobacteriaceae bacterium M23B6Z8]
MKFNSESLTIANSDRYIHTEADIISEKAKAISEKLGIVKEGLYSGHSTMTNYIYTDAPIDKMVNVLVTYDALFYLDDVFGEDTRTGQLPDAQKIIEIWKGEKMYSSANIEIQKLYESIGYVSRRLRKDCSKVFFEKFTTTITDHLSNSLTSKAYQTVDDYTKIRLATSGMYIPIDLIEYVHSIYVDEELRNTENLFLKQLCEQCALIGALSNDLFSYSKEKHSDYNLINAFLLTKEASNYHEAVTKSIAKVNSIHAHFKATLSKARQAVTSLPANEQLIIDRYLNSLEVIVASSYHWQKSTNRYYHHENVFEDMKASVLEI